MKLDDLKNINKDFWMGNRSKPVKPSDQTPPSLLEDLGKGEKILKQNLETDEEIKVKLKGSFGEGLVLTNKRLYVVKWGFMTNNPLGGKCTSYEYRNITGIQIKKSILTGVVEVLSPSNQDNRNLSYWTNKGGNNAKSADNAITFQNQAAEKFYTAVTLGRQLLARAHESHTENHQNQNSGLDELEKLAGLRDKGIISEEEFQVKKKKILDL